MKTITKNRRGTYDYEILETHVCGMVLVGTEIKNIKINKVSINEAYCFIDNNEIFIKGMFIEQHKETSNRLNHNPTRDRKLLMKKKEIVKLFESSSQKGLTIIPLEVFISDTGFIKLKIGLGKGKKSYDKRVSIKKKDLDRDMQRK